MTLHSLSIAERLLAKRDIHPDGCWIWAGARQTHGYGMMWDGRVKRPVLVHRLSAEIWLGITDPHVDVLHTCDQPACFNPEHLWGGTHAENMADSMRKGRAAKRLTPEAVRIIKAALAGSAKIKPLARQFSVDPNVIRQIRDGRTWAWLKP